LRGATTVPVSIRGASQRERLLLQTILKASGSGVVERIRIEPGPVRTRSGRRIVFVVHPTDSVSGTRGKWTALLVGRTFAEAAARRGLPRIGVLVVVTRGIPKGEGRRLVARMRLLQSRPSVPRSPLGLLPRRRTRSVELRHLVAFRLLGRRPEAVEVSGTLRAPAAYLRVLSTIAGARPVGRGAYYELSGTHGKVLMRFGLVNGLAPKDRLVGWVSPSLLKSR
jgi:hypothetical protein